MQAWEDFLKAQEAHIGVETVKKWLRSLKILRFDACNLYLEADDAFQILWFEEHIREKVNRQLYNQNQKKIRVHLVLANGPPVEPRKKKSKPSKKGSKYPLPETLSLSFDPLNPYNTFKNFVVSENNELPCKLLGALAGRLEISGHLQDRSFCTFNPIYLHGLSGTGKTHLLMATVTALQENGLKAIYTSAETFTQHVINAIRMGEMGTFREMYRNTDVLVIDDIHVFSKKGATQEEFFHTFNALHLNGQQLILGANCPPGDLQYIEPRLISRFEWGIVLNLATHNQMDLKHILQKKIDALNFPIPERTIEFLVQTFSRNTKNLIRAYEALILRSYLHTSHSPEQITIPLTQKLLNDLIKEEEKNILTPDKILFAVSQHFGIRNEDLMSRAQTGDCVLPRQMAMHFCRFYLKMPFVKIGNLFSKDHSTVISSIRQIQKKLDTNHKETLNSWNKISTILRTL